MKGQYRQPSIYATIGYYRYLMNDAIDRSAAELFAGWFQALADPTRVQILNLLAVRRDPMTVGEIVEQVAVGQPTVSHHLRILSTTCFVHVEARGTARLYRINERCIECFPSA